MYESFNETNGSVKFHAGVRVNIHSHEEALKWIDAFEESAHVKLKKPLGRASAIIINSSRFIFKGKWVCQHARNFASGEPQANLHGRPKQKMCIDCPMHITLKILRQTYWTIKVHKEIQKFPLSVELNFDHNHSYFSARSLSHNSVSQEAKESLSRLFRNGMGVRESYNAHRKAIVQIHKECKDAHSRCSIEAVLADASICPTERQVWYMFAKFTEEIFGAHNGTKIWEHIDTYVKEYNVRNSEQGGCIKYRPPVKSGNEFVIALSSPLMTRVRKMYNENAAMIFVDSTGSVDSHECVVTLFVIATNCGALPVGITIAGGKSEGIYTVAFQMLKAVIEKIDKSSFQPKIAMTDHDDAIRNSLTTVWPEITLLLCLFHILQAVWRYLFSIESGIGKENRQAIFQKSKLCVYGEECDTEIAKHNLLNMQEMSAPATTYFSQLWKVSKEWILYHRSKLNYCGHNTNNNCEIIVRTFKEGVMHRVRAVCLGQLLINLTQDHDGFFSNRLFDTSHWRCVNLVLFVKGMILYLQ